MQLILKEDWTTSASPARWSTSRRDTERTTCCRAGWRSSRPPTTSRAWRTKSASSRRARRSWPRRSQSEADRLAQITVSIARAVGDEDKLFGSVTSRDIAEALAEQKVTVDAKKIHLDEPIKALGMTEVPIKLGQGVTAKIKVWVVKKE